MPDRMEVPHKVLQLKYMEESPDTSELNVPMYAKVNKNWMPKLPDRMEVLQEGMQPQESQESSSYVFLGLEAETSDVEDDVQFLNAE